MTPPRFVFICFFPTLWKTAKENKVDIHYNLWNLPIEAPVRGGENFHISVLISNDLKKSR